MQRPRWTNVATVTVAVSRDLTAAELRPGVVGPADFEVTP